MSRVVCRWLLLLCVAAAARADAPADSTKRRKFSIIPVPVVGYTPETKWVGGIFTGFVYHFSDSLRPSSAGLKAFYSQRKQIVLGFDPEIYVGGWQLADETEYLRWPDSFFGIGNNVPEENEEEYSARVIGTDLNIRREWYPHLYGGLRYKFEDTKLLETEPGGLLATDALPAPVEGTTSGAGLVAVYDSRDNIFFPMHGLRYAAGATFYGPGLGSDFTYDKYGVDLRNYFTLTGSHVLALQAAADFTDGDSHFRNYSVIGGEEKLRGYNGARFRDRHSMYAQAEYRFPVWWRFRAAVFTGAGDVANAVADFAPGKFKHVVGGGLRFLAIPKEKIYVRLDMGWGINSDGFYLSVNEAF